MAISKPLILENGKKFEAQGLAVDHFKKLLHSIKHKVTKEHEEFSDLLALYKRHPDFGSKSQSEANIEYFHVKNSGEYNTLCFHVVHKDGTQTDWSYKTAITAQKKTPFQCYVDGARHALELRDTHFRDDNFTEKCKAFLQECGYSENQIPTDFVSEDRNSQYRSSLLEPIKSKFLLWYKTKSA